MNSIQRFFKTVYTSATQPASYPPRANVRFSSALGYLYWLLVCTTFISALTVAFALFSARPDIKAFVDNAAQNLGDMYPDELEVTISGAILSTNVKTPYNIDPSFWSSETFQKELSTNKQEMPLHFITIDPDATVEMYTSMDTLVLFTRTAVVTHDSDGVRVIPYTDMELTEPLTFNKEMYTELVTAVIPFVNMIPGIIDGLTIALVILIPFIGAFFSGVIMLIYLLGMTALLQLMAILMKRSLTYGQLYRLGMYGVTLPVLHSVIINFIPALSFSFVFSFIFLIWMGVVLRSFPLISTKAPVSVRAAALKKTSTGSPWDEHS